MPTRNVNLTEHNNSFIDSRVAAGRFSDVNEVISVALQLLEREEEDEQAKIEWLRAAIQVGIDDIERGDYVTLRSHEEIDAFVHKAANSRH